MPDSHTGLAASVLDASEIQSFIPEYKRRIEKSSTRLLEYRARNYSAARLVRFRVRAVDTIMREVWNLFSSQYSECNSMCLVAVGGYGREELNPYSDIDLLLLIENRDRVRFEPVVKKFVRFLWDIGFEIGHSVRTLGDCTREARADITVMTNLLEARYCAGSQSLYQQLELMIQNSKIWPIKKFFRAKLHEQKLRHHKFSDTAYNLEPNIKDGPGGLRDIHTVNWVAMRYFQNRNLHELVEHGFLHEDEYMILIRGRNYLWKLRNELHLTIGRREDRLLFAHQIKLAESFGYYDDDANKAVEKLMRTYFRTVKELRHINLMLLQHFDEMISARKRKKFVQLSEQFRTVDDYLELSHPEKIGEQPELLIEACALFHEHKSLRGVRASTMRLMRSNNQLINRSVRQKPKVCKWLRGILGRPHRMPETLQLMDDTGVLSRLIPEFGRVVGQLQYDLFHVYTVDAHLLHVVWHLNQLMTPEGSKQLPLVKEALGRVTKLERLFIAGLFHDIAKGRGGDHSELGEKVSYDFCKRIGMSDYDAHIVAWLVRHHLAMSFTSQKEDLNDPEVISRFAVKVGNQEHLDLLYLLTVADMRGTGPTVWNNWKGNMLSHLFLATSKALLTDTLPHEKIEPRIREIKSDALVVIGKNQENKKSAKILWEQLDDDYFLSYDVRTIVWHLQLAASTSVIDLPIIAFRIHPSIDTVIQAFVMAANSEDLFVIISGALDRCYLNVVEARTHPMNTGLTVFSFVVMPRHQLDVHSRFNLAGFESEVRESIINRTIEHSPSTIAQGSVARHISFPTRVQFSHSDNLDYSLMHIAAQDRPGLLYLVVKTLLNHKIRLLSAKITTTGERVEDVFFIVDRDGNYLRDKQIQQSLSNDILQALSS